MSRGVHPCAELGDALRAWAESRAWQRSRGMRAQDAVGAKAGAARTRLFGLNDLIDSEVEEDVSDVRIAVHVEACPSCRQKAENIIKVVQVLASMPAHSAPADLELEFVSADESSVEELEGDHADLIELLRTAPQRTAPAELDAYVEALLAGTVEQDELTSTRVEPQPPLPRGSRRPVQLTRVSAFVAAAAAILIGAFLFMDLGFEKTTRKYTGVVTGLELQFRSTADEAETPEGRRFLGILAGWAAAPWTGSEVPAADEPEGAGKGNPR